MIRRKSAVIGSGGTISSVAAGARHCVGGDFSPQKARILLMLALKQTSGPAEIAALFANT
jgi:L-asparaginase/Glu-tRNA(Gln) amidotransferase subunit D